MDGRVDLRIKSRDGHDDKASEARSRMADQQQTRKRSRKVNNFLTSPLAPCYCFSEISRGRSERRLALLSRVDRASRDAPSTGFGPRPGIGDAAQRDHVQVGGLADSETAPESGEIAQNGLGERATAGSRARGPNSVMERRSHLATGSRLRASEGLRVLNLKLSRLPREWHF